MNTDCRGNKVSFKKERSTDKVLNKWQIQLMGRGGRTRTTPSPNSPPLRNLFRKKFLQINDKKIKD